MDVRLPHPGQPHAVLTATWERSPLAIDPAQLMALYTRHGALLLRGFGADLDSFAGFTQQFCTGSVFNESPDRHLLDAAHNIQTVNGGTAPFPLHPELSREPWKPDICFFGCLEPPRSLGATTLCDGVDLVSQLPAAVRDGLAGRRLRYMQPVNPAILEYWLGTPSPDAALLAAPPPGCPYSFDWYDNQLVRVFTRPALHTPMFTAAPAFGNFLLFSFFHNRMRGYPSLDDGSAVPDAWLAEVKATGDRLSAAVQWQRGDLLMLDNSRFMHGRTAVVPDDVRLIASFFGYLKNAPRNPEEPVDPPWRRTEFRPPTLR
jgi:alpha-ketoglutarate-dependent taurine dioxygenase